MQTLELNALNTSDAALFAQALHRDSRAPMESKDAPAATDRAAWWTIVRSAELAQHSESDILGAFDQHNGHDDALAVQLKARLVLRMDGLIGRYLRPRGYGRESHLWADIAKQLSIALETPYFGLGANLRRGFFNTVTWFIKDEFDGDSLENAARKRARKSAKKPEEQDQPEATRSDDPRPQDQSDDPTPHFVSLDEKFDASLGIIDGPDAKIMLEDLSTAFAGGNPHRRLFWEMRIERHGQQKMADEIGVSLRTVQAWNAQFEALVRENLR